MASRALFTVVAVVGIAAASGAAWWYQNRGGKPAGEAPLVAEGASGAASAAPGASAPQAAGSAPRNVAVEAARVQLVRLVDDAQTVGNLRSRQSVVLRPEVSGRVTQLNFRDGERVRRGQLLVQLDDQLPLAQVQQSQAELSIAQANHKRNQELVGQGFISQRSVDESGANLQVAQAKLALSQATAARLRIVAPFDAIAGIRTINIGDYLKDGADIVNLEDIDAMYVDYRLPERFQTKVAKGQRALVEVDALPGRKFTAVVQAIDPQLDANGRSVAVRGCIDNRSLQLRPGMFARVASVFGERNDAMVIPEEAIVPQGGRVFVIRLVDGAEAGTRTTQRVEVKVGLRQPGKVEIVSGLQPGDTVVTAGQQRIQKDGTAVRVVDLAARARAAASGASAPGAAASSPVLAASAPALAGSMAVSALRPASSAARAASAGPNPCTVGVAPPARSAAMEDGARRPRNATR